MHIQYPCDDCDYSANKLVQLKDHARSKHNGLQVFCDETDCKFVGNSQSFPRHKRTKHEMLKIPFNECEYTAGRKDQLKNHKLVEHQ